MPPSDTDKPNLPNTPPTAPPQAEPTRPAGLPKPRKKTLIWTLNGGTEVSTATATKAQWENERQVLKSRVDRLIDTAIQVELVLEDVARALRLSQPPMSGKYDLRWWLNGSGRRDPVLVRWESINNRFTPRIVRRVRTIHDHDGFAVNHAQTRGLLQCAQELLAARTKLLAGIGNVKRSLHAHDSAHSMWLENERAKVDTLKNEVIQNLLAHGYSVDSQTQEDMGL